MQLDTELAKWRERALGEYPFLFLDAYYEQVREDGQVRNLAILIAVGVNRAGKREILGVSVSLVSGPSNVSVTLCHFFCSPVILAFAPRAGPAQTATRTTSATGRATRPAIPR